MSPCDPTRPPCDPNVASHVHAQHAHAPAPAHAHAHVTCHMRMWQSVAKMAKIKPQMEIYTEKMKKATARGASGVQDASKVRHHSVNMAPCGPT
eukprot:1530871-Prymnesium_polylepis.1